MGSSRSPRAIEIWVVRTKRVKIFPTAETVRFALSGRGSREAIRSSEARLTGLLRAMRGGGQFGVIAKPGALLVTGSLQYPRAGVRGRLATSATKATCVGRLPGAARHQPFISPPVFLESTIRRYRHGSLIDFRAPVAAYVSLEFKSDEGRSAE